MAKKEKSLHDRVYDNFKRDIKEHTIEIIKDDDVYKHISFGEPGTRCMRVEILTSPDHLFYYGDMGSYCFTRNKYMLGFFANDRGINPHYWMEKIVASSEPPMELSQKEIEKNVLEEVESYVESYHDSLSKKKRGLLTKTIFDDVMDSVSFNGDSDYWLSRAISDVMDYSNSEYPELTFEDFYEYGCKEYTTRYLWCCFALNHVANYYFKNIYKEEV